MNVLIAHSDESIRHALARAVNDCGDVQVSECRLEEAVARCIAAPPDLILAGTGSKAAVHSLTEWARSLSDPLPPEIMLIVDSETELPDPAGSDPAAGWLRPPPAQGDLAWRIASARRLRESRKQACHFQETLIQSRDKLKVVFDALVDPIVSVDAQRRILSCNRAFAERCGKPFPVLIGSTVLDQPWVRALGAAVDTLADEITRAFQSGRAHRTQVASDDDACHLEVHFISVLDDNRSVTQVTLVLADVTAVHKKSEEVLALNNRLTVTLSELNQNNAVLTETLAQLNQSQAQQLQSEKLAAIGQLAAGMAHEINNPIGFVSSNIRTLRGYFEELAELRERYHAFARQATAGVAPPDLDALRDEFATVAAWEASQDIDMVITDAEELIDDCCEGLGRVERIVRELSEFSRPNDTAPGPVDLNASLDAALSVISADGMTGIDVQRRYGSDVCVTASARDLNQALLQVLLNAVQAMTDGGQLCLETCRDADQVLVRVSDTGSGIPTDILPRIFEPFFTTKPVGAGSGLGLNAAYQTVTRHGGTIQVASQPQAGTTVSIRVPVTPDFADNEGPPS